MNFIGRKEELEKLNRAMQADEMNFSLIYGRRRVGKSELVCKALSKIKAKKLYYECKQVAEGSNVNGLSEILSESMGLPKLAFSNMESLLDYIFELSSRR